MALAVLIEKYKTSSYDQRLNYHNTSRHVYSAAPRPLHISKYVAAYNVPSNVRTLKKT